jgi:hypothetical protein
LSVTKSSHSVCDQVKSRYFCLWSSQVTRSHKSFCTVLFTKLRSKNDVIWNVHIKREKQ